MQGAAIPAVAVLVALLLASGGKKKKKGTKRPTNGNGNGDRPGYEEGDKRDPADREKRPGDTTPSDLPDAPYDPDFFDAECGPGWINLDGDCLWLSEYDAPDVPRDGLWIAPDCAAAVVGADWWEEVAVPEIEAFVEAGYGKRFNWEEMYEDPEVWWETSAAAAYLILAAYDLGPINPATGKRDTDEMCLDLFPFSSPDFEWYANNPRPFVEDYVGPENADTESPEWQAYYAAIDAWMAEKDAYWAELVDVMPQVAQIFTVLNQAIVDYHEAYWGSGAQS
jgi:hypothetical protein